MLNKMPDRRSVAEWSAEALVSRCIDDITYTTLGAANDAQQIQCNAKKRKAEKWKISIFR